MDNIYFSGINAALHQINTILQQADINQTISSVSQSNSYENITHISLPQIPVGELTLLSSGYTLKMPSEIDIFSELPMRAFSDDYNSQMGAFMRQFRVAFYKSIQEKGNINKMYPKLTLKRDEEGSELIHLHSFWKEGEALLYFSFEQDPCESSMGIIWNDDKNKNYETRVGSLSLNDTNELLHEAIDFIIRVY